MNGRAARALRRAVRDEHTRWVRERAEVHVTWWARLALRVLRWLAGFGAGQKLLGRLAARVGRAGTRLVVNPASGPRVARPAAPAVLLPASRESNGRPAARFFRRAA